MSIEKYEKIGNYTVQGYLDDTHGEIRLFDENGDQRLYYFESKTEKVLEGDLKQSTRAKEIAQIMINKLIAAKTA